MREQPTQADRDLAASVLSILLPVTRRYPSLARAGTPAAIAAVRQAMRPHFASYTFRDAFLAWVALGRYLDGRGEELPEETPEHDAVTWGWRTLADFLYGGSAATHDDAAVRCVFLAHDLKESGGSPGHAVLTETYLTMADDMGWLANDKAKYQGRITFAGWCGDE